MSTSAIEHQKAAAREVFVQQPVYDKAAASASAHDGKRISTVERRPDYILEPPAEKQIRKQMDDEAFRRTARGDAGKRTGVLQKFDVLAKRQSPRIAFKSKGKIVFIDPVHIIAVTSAGNYVLLNLK